MKCEIKMLDKTLYTFLNDIKIHPLSMTPLFLKSILISVPIVVLNEIFTKDNDCVCVLAFVVLVVVLYRLLNQKCKNIKTDNDA